jgi:hypothetical protein
MAPAIPSDMVKDYASFMGGAGGDFGDLEGAFGGGAGGGDSDDDELPDLEN